jgi:TonB-linked SusC/RagA family outer membrane protein
MVKIFTNSIFSFKCLKKFSLTFGLIMVLLLQGSYLVSAGSTSGVSISDDLQQRSVTGRVSDAKGNPMPGVNVIEKGTSNGVLSGADGRYSITVASGNSVITFSFIGYEVQEIAVGAQTTLNVTLAEALTGLNEVVVIGYGTQRKEAVTGSVSTITGNVLRDVPSANISQALQARIPGVDMEQTSSKPGATMQIRVRGTRSLNASNDPLVVVDGIPFAGSLGDLNPNDIKSLDILKDASATAIYGSRGANGVILITTNKGAIGQKGQVTFNSYYGLKKIFARYPMMNGPEFVALRKAAGKYTNSLDEADDVNTDWQDLFYRTGLVSSHDLGISGGTEKGNYNFGVGYFQDKAVIPTQQYERFSIRGALDQAVGKYFRFGFTTNNNYNITKGTQMDLGGVLALSPIANPYNANGSWKRTIKMPLDEYWTNTRAIADSLSDKWLSQTKAYGSYNSLYGEVKIPGVEGLKYRINVGLNFRMSNGGSYTGEGINSSTATTVSTASISNSLTTNWAIENLLTYDRTFAGKHQVNAVALYSAEQSMYNSSYVSARDIPADAFQFYNLGRAAGEIAVNPDYQGYNMTGLISYMGRVMYSYDSRYMVSVSYRSDGSSRLAPGQKWHSYPAISAGWNIKNESFMQDIALINSLKLRVGYGETSNQSVNPYSTLGLLATRPYNFGSSYSTGYYVSTLPNPNLGWEFSKTWNFGIDFGLLKNRLTGTVEYYVMNTDKVLLSVNLPATSGVNSYMANIGKTQNKGLELSLNGVILDNRNGWTWEAGFNLYANRNKLVALASGQTRDENNWWFVGHPIDVIYDYEAVGIWQQDDQYLLKYEPGGNVGMIKVKYTGKLDSIPASATFGQPLRQIGPADRQIISVEPKFQGGFNTRVAYKGFDLSAVGAFQSGGILISTLYGDQSYLNILTARRGNIKVDYWTTENTGAKFPKPGGIGGDQPKYLRSQSYFDASFLKIRTITLSYNFEQNSWVKNAGFNKLRLYVTLQNPFVMFSPYHKQSGMDPETNSYGNENSATTGFYQRRLLTLGTNTPTTRNYLIGLNLTF